MLAADGPARLIPASFHGFDVERGKEATMNLFSRLSELLDLHFDSFPDRGEELEPVVNDLLAEMEEIVGGVRAYVATVIAGERRLARELHQVRAELDKWRRRARLVPSAGKGGLAHEALLYTRDLEEGVSRLQRQHAAAVQASAELRISLDILKTRLVKARRKHGAMLAWERIALARIGLHRRLSVGTDDNVTAEGRFGRLEAELGEIQEELQALVRG
jgi:phage shock protein A